MCMMLLYGSIDGEELLANRYSLGLLINVDWFQPYKHISYSVGAIYISILNFPRHLRNLRENTILIGVIPGPNEPKLHMNSFLEPLVMDLLKLRRGVRMATPEGEQLIRAVLLCSASDIPASRKLGGFLGHAAARGCSRCLKVFPTDNFGEKPDYSGFDRSTWPERTVEEHRLKGMSWKHSSTLAKRHDIEHQYGVRFTKLLRLQYFDTVRFIVIDPMHNMLLGTAKNMVALWKSSALLSEKDFDSIQFFVNKFVTPSDVGRIPYKIASNFSGFTADQWKNWTLIFSTIVLKPILPSSHYHCWCLFVDACRLLCSRAISHDGLEKMDSLILRFCRMFEQLYGAQACTPNLHLHCHLKQCLLDFGPAGFSGFTADQWKNWTLIFSTIVLKPILPSSHYHCWCLFVDACRLLCSRAISHDGLEKMDSLILRFCRMFEQLYGAQACTPNLHLHCHLKQCLLDFGPAGSFWAFPFERLNGILGSVPTNHQAIETQLMRKFSSNQQTVHALKNSGDNSLQQLFQPFVNSKGSLKHEQTPELPLLSSLSVSSIKSHCEACKLIPPVKEACLHSDEHRLIENTLQHYFGDAYVKIMLIHKYSRAAYFWGDLYGSVNSIHSNSAMVLAKRSSGLSVPCFIKKFVKVTIVLLETTEMLDTCNPQESTFDIYLAAINWLEEHPNKDYFSSPIEVWRKFIPCSTPEDFIPVSCIVCRCAYIEDMIKFNSVLQETVTVVVPIHYFYGL